MHILRLQRLSLLLALAWMGTIFFLSHQPSLPAPSLFEHQDKLFHGGSYGLLGLLLAVALRDPAQPGRTLWIVWLLGSLYGLADEYHQSLVPGRDADLLDALADSAGAWLGAAVGSLVGLKPDLQTTTVHPSHPAGRTSVRQG